MKREDRERFFKPGFLRGLLCGVIIVVAVLVVVGIVILAGFRNVSYSDTVLLDNSTEEKIDMLADYIEESYYEDVPIEELREGLYAGLFENLDVYSEYYTEEEYEDLLASDIEGVYSGIGATLEQNQETMLITIIRIYDGSPAQEAGLKVGDIMYKADDYEASDMDLSEFVTHVRGEEGTSVHLLIYREGEEMEFDVTRRNLEYPTVEWDMLDGNIGYISISEFTESTTAQFESALESLEDKGMESLIVDLRSNPGGVLDGVCEILDDILPAGLIVYTEERDGQRIDFDSTDDRSLDIPLAVLVNGSSASASEIFAGAIQDREAGVIIGTQTYGKGVVQTIRQLSDGSAVKITTSRYFTPNGVCIQGIGITPDIVLEYEFLGDEDEDYSYELDNQIQAAVQYLSGD